MPVISYHTVNGRIVSQLSSGQQIDLMPDALGSVVRNTNSGIGGGTNRFEPHGGTLTNSPLFGSGRFGWNGSSGFRITNLDHAEIDGGRGLHYSTSIGRLVSSDQLPHSRPIIPEYFYDPRPLKAKMQTDYLSRLLRRGRKKGAIDAYYVTNAVATRLAPCMSPEDAQTIAQTFACVVAAESTFNPKATKQGTVSVARGLTQLGNDQFDSCARSPRCKGKVYDPACNLEAAVNMWIEMCNHPLYDRVKRREVPGTVPNTVSSLRGCWGVTRDVGEGEIFKDCMKTAGITEGDLRRIPCPKKSPSCPGCTNNYHGLTAYP